MATFLLSVIAVSTAVVITIMIAGAVVIMSVAEFVKALLNIPQSSN